MDQSDIYDVRLGSEEQISQSNLHLDSEPAVLGREAILFLNQHI